MRNGCEVLDLGRRAYGSALDLQRELVEKRQRGAIGDTLVLVEHDPPVLTLGRRANASNIRAGAAELAHRGIGVHRIGRGGDATFHGPGQLVGYPIVDLRAAGLGVRRYVDALQETLIRALATFGIQAARDPAFTGVWIGGDKIAAIGVRVQRGVTMHGFALNVSVDLGYYDLIVPCGIQGRGVTSIEKLVGRVGMADVKKAVVREFCRGWRWDEQVRQRCGSRHGCGFRWAGVTNSRGFAP